MVAIKANGKVNAAAFKADTNGSSAENIFTAIKFEAWVAATAATTKTRRYFVAILLSKIRDQKFLTITVTIGITR